MNCHVICLKAEDSLNQELDCRALAVATTLVLSMTRVENRMPKATDFGPT
jgi:hypothetical protein